MNERVAVVATLFTVAFGISGVLGLKALNLLPPPTFEGWLGYLMGPGWWLWVGFAGIPFLTWYLLRTGFRRKTVEVTPQSRKVPAQPTARQYAYSQSFPTEKPVPEPEPETNEQKVSRLVASIPTTYVAQPQANEMQSRETWEEAMLKVERLLRTEPSGWQSGELHMKFGNVELTLIKGNGVAKDVPVVNEKPEQPALPVPQVPPPIPQEEE